MLAGYPNSMPISSHPRLNPGRQRFAGCMARLGLLGAGLGVVGLLAVGIGYGLPLLILMIPFLIGLSVPLLTLTSLHPAITIEDGGLRLTPLVWKSSFVGWQDVERLTTHTLLKPAPPERYQRRRKGAAVHSGHMLVARRGALPWHYCVVGVMAGFGWRPVFAVSNQTHTEYEKLHRELRQRLSSQEREA
jgi:hypothetical protein